jgi:hypothetical protein
MRTSGALSAAMMFDPLFCLECEFEIVHNMEAGGGTFSTFEKIASLNGEGVAARSNWSADGLGAALIWSGD